MNQSSLKHTITVAFIAILGGIFIWKWTTPIPKSQEPAPGASLVASPQIEEKQLIETDSPLVSSPPPSPTPVPIVPSAPSPPLPTWIFGNEARLKDSADALRKRLESAESLKGAILENELRTIATTIGELGAILDSTPPIPRVPMNIPPPMLRADGSRYLSQGVMAGMDPKAIWDPERRQAYIEVLARAAEKNAKRNWLTHAKFGHFGLLHHLDSVIGRAIMTSELTKEMGEQIHSLADRQKTEPGD